MPSAEELSELLLKLARPVQEGKIITLQDFFKTQRDILNRLKKEYSFFPNKKSLPFRYLTNYKRFPWGSLKPQALKQALIFYYVVWGVKNMNKDLFSKVPSLEKAFTSKKFQPHEVLLEYGFLPGKTYVSQKDVRALKTILRLRYEKYLQNDNETYPQFKNKVSRVTEELRELTGLTLSQLLEEFGHECSRQIWANRSGPWLEAHINGLWETGDYRTVGTLRAQNDGPCNALVRDHYTTPGDAIIKSSIEPKLKYLPRLLDYFVCNFLKKKIRACSVDELMKALKDMTSPRVFNVDELLRTKRKNLGKRLMKHFKTRANVETVLLRIQGDPSG